MFQGFKKWIAKRKLKKTQDLEELKKIENKINESKDNIKVIESFKIFNSTLQLPYDLKSEKKVFENYKKWREFKKESDAKSKIGELLAPYNRISAMIFLRGGNIDFIEVDATKTMFEYSLAMYTIDTTKVYNIKSFSSKISFYVQDLTLPLDFKDAIDKLLDDVKNNKLETNVSLSLDSKVFERLIKSEFVQKLMAGAEMLDQMSFLKILGIVLGIVSILSFIINVIGLFV